MRYRVVFEYQSEDGAMSDVYNYRNEEQAFDKFAELQDFLENAIDPTDHSGWEIVDEESFYSIINHYVGIYGYVRLLTD